jgi:hypothetical protein
MINYNIIIWFNDGQKLELSVSHENLYSLQTSVAGMGKNGVWHMIDEKNRIYFPPYKIDRIEVTQI